MKRALSFLAAFVAVSVATVLLLALFAFGTGPGRRMVADMLEVRLGDAINADIDIAAIKGALPNHVRAEGVAISRDGKSVADLDLVEMKWRPLTLLRREIRIDSLAFLGATLHAPPPTEKDGGGGFKFSDRLPTLSIDRVTFSDIRLSESLAGAPLRLDGEGSLSSGGKAFAARLAAVSTNERDKISVFVDRKADRAAPVIDVRIESHADGALSTLTRSEGPIAIELRGDGPAEAFRMTFGAALGSHGSLNGSAVSNLSANASTEVSATLALGDRYASLKEELGEALEIQGVIDSIEQATSITISALKSRIGEASGKILWTGARQDSPAPALEFDLSALLAEGWRPDLQRFVGDKVRLAGRATRADEIYEGDVSVIAPLAELRMSGFQSDLKGFWHGPARLVMAESANAPLAMKRGLTATGLVDIERDKPIRFNDAAVETRDGGTFKGEASYALATRLASIEGDATLSPAFVNALSPRTTLSGPATARITLSGNAQDFALRVAGVTPSIKQGAFGIAPSSHAIALSGSFEDFGGLVSSRALKGDRALKTRVARRPSGEWRFFDLSYEGKGFALAGAGAIDWQARNASLDLKYAGDDEATPLPGVGVHGDAFIRGEIGRAGAKGIELSIPSISAGEIAVDGLSAILSGPRASLGADITADAARLPGGVLISALTTRLEMSADDPGRLIIASLDALVNDAAARLQRPATISFNEGVAMTPVVFAFGGGGSMEFTGDFSRKRWRANTKLRQAPVFGGAALADADIALDTASAALAAGGVTISSTFDQSEASEIALKFLWDGRRVTISNAAARPEFIVDLTAPLGLRRTPDLKLIMPTEISGRVRYEGRIETISALLPTFAQNFEGRISLSGDISGALKRPKMSGALTITDGAFTDLSSGVSIVDIDGEAKARSDIEGSGIDFEFDGAGPGQAAKTLNAKGAINFVDGPVLDSSITFERLRLSAGPVELVEATGDISVSGSLSQLKAVGSADVSRLDAELFEPKETGLVDINVVVQGAGPVRAISRAAARQSPVRYALRIAADDNINIRGRGLESEWKTAAVIDSAGDRPLVIGRLELIDGQLRLGGRRIQLTRGLIEFDRLAANDPALDIRAERRTSPGPQVSIRVGGRASAPEIKIESSPAMPQEDAMALLLFDKPMSDLTALQSLQVADSLSELGGVGLIGGKGIAATARSALGLDLLDVSIDETNSAASVLTVGKYVTDGLFVSASQDARGEAGSVTIEYEINDSFSIETELRQDGDQTISANWKKDF